MVEESALTISESETPGAPEKPPGNPSTASQEAANPIADPMRNEASGPIRSDNLAAAPDHDLSGTNTGGSKTGAMPSLIQTESNNGKSAAKMNNDARSPDSPGARMRTASSGNAIEMQSIRNIKVKVEAVLGGLYMPVSQLAQIKHGEIIHLDRQIGEEIEITANGQLIGRGEIVVVEDDVPKFGITLTEIY